MNMDDALAFAGFAGGVIFLVPYPPKKGDTGIKFLF
jgi:hypothetical protein